MAESVESALRREITALEQEIAVLRQKSDSYETQLLMGDASKLAGDCAAMYVASEYSRSFLHRSACPNDICEIVRRLVLSPMFISRFYDGAYYGLRDWSMHELVVIDKKAKTQNHVGRIIHGYSDAYHALDAKRNISYHSYFKMTGTYEARHYYFSDMNVKTIPTGYCRFGVYAGHKDKCDTYAGWGEIKNVAPALRHLPVVCAAKNNVINILTQEEDRTVDIESFIDGVRVSPMPIFSLDSDFILNDINMTILESDLVLTIGGGKAVTADRRKRMRSVICDDIRDRYAQICAYSENLCVCFGKSESDALSTCHVRDLRGGLGIVKTFEISSAAWPPWQLADRLL